jgi:predicted short-subunit dehydrogenase-like oxidoreductase (DUF2520 family)
MATLNIIGPGRVGRTLGRLFATRGGFEIQDVLVRGEGSEALDFIGAGRPCQALADMRAADAWMLTVPDDQLQATAEALAAGHRLADTLVFHCSGAYASDVLAPARAAGALVASAHPVRSFADPAQVAAGFDGTPFGVEGDPSALARLLPALERIGGRAIPIDGAAKTLYHAASVFACNYLTTVLDAALRAYAAAGVAPHLARELAAPLARETLDNVFRIGPGAALTGPVARGDWATVARQQEALDQLEPAMGELYAALAKATAQLAARRHAA